MKLLSSVLSNFLRLFFFALLWCAMIDMDLLRSCFGPFCFDTMWIKVVIFFILLQLLEGCLDSKFQGSVFSFKFLKYYHDLTNFQSNFEFCSGMLLTSKIKWE